MKKIIIVAASIFVLASLMSVANAKTTHTEKQQQAATSKKVEKTEKQATDDSKKVEKEAEDATPQIGSKTDSVQGRGLPKAFSGSDDSQ